MKETNKKEADYIQNLEDKIVDLSLQLKNEKNKLNTIQNDNLNTIRALVHNLKNPIGVAFSFTEILAESNLDFLAEKGKKYLEAIKNSTKFSIEILNSVGDLNRLKCSTFKLNLQKTNYKEVLNSAINSCKVEAEAKKIAIITLFPPNDIYLKLDVAEIEKAIIAVVKNAIRYSLENGTINITIIKNKTTVETIIKDEGIGISEANLTSIFNEFSVVNTYSQDGKKCVGLGLPIANNIIKKHFGKLKVFSSLGKGSTFTIVLPNSF